MGILYHFLFPFLPPPPLLPVSQTCISRRGWRGKYVNKRAASTAETEFLINLPREYLGFETLKRVSGWFCNTLIISHRNKIAHFAPSLFPRPQQNRTRKIWRFWWAFLYLLRLGILWVNSATALTLHNHCIFLFCAIVKNSAQANLDIPQIRNYAPNMIQKRKESASLGKGGTVHRMSS